MYVLGNIGRGTEQMEKVKRGTEHENTRCIRENLGKEYENKGALLKR